jgi:hypothetical protein
MRHKDAAEYHQKVIGRHELSGEVPETTAKSFERLRTLYAYGVLCYDLYTVAGDLARLVTEQALRDRFLPFYDGTVNFTDAQGKPQVVQASSFDDLYRAIRKDDGRLKGWKLKLRSGHKPFVFNGTLASLLSWARAEGLLAGQRDRMRDEPRAWFRNYVAHPGYHLQDPGHAEWAIADLANIINRLWGAPSGTPVHRQVMMIAWDDRTVTWAPAGNFSGGPQAGTLAFVLVLAGAEVPELASYDAQYECTYWPCDYLWGPGTLRNAQAWLQEHQPTGDQAATIDRLFLLRYNGDLLYIPRKPALAAALSEDERQGTWYLIRADSPFDAFSHQRQVLAGVPGHTPGGKCTACPVDTISSGDLQPMLRQCRALGADVTPRPVPDIRVAISCTPRCNRILGNGAWDIPPG